MILLLPSLAALVFWFYFLLIAFIVCVAALNIITPIALFTSDERNDRIAAVLAAVTVIAIDVTIAYPWLKGGTE